MHSGESGKTILLVEDEHVTCLMMERTLRRGGYHTLVVNSGEDALEILECVKGVDLVLMDINLGEGMNGIEASSLIMQRHDLPVVFLSSHTEREILEEADRVGSCGYDVKKSDDAVLFAAIRTAFRLFEARLTEREHLNKLRKTEERFNGIFDHSIFGIFRTTLDGRCNAINPAFVRMFGFDSFEEVKDELFDIGTQVYAVPEDRDRLIKLVYAHNGVIRNHELELRRRDGTTFWILLNARLYFNDEENAPIFEGTCIDITEHKRAREKVLDLLFDNEDAVNYLQYYRRME